MSINPLDHAAAVFYRAGHRERAIAMNEVDLHIDQHQRNARVVIAGRRQVQGQPGINRRLNVRREASADAAAIIKGWK